MYFNKKPLSRLASLINACSTINNNNTNDLLYVHIKLTIGITVYNFVQISNNPVQYIQGLTLSSLQLSTVSNDDLLGGLSAVRAVALDLLHHVHSLDNTPEHHMLTVKPAHTR